MGKIRVEYTDQRIEAEVPKSLLDFIVDWAETGKHSQQAVIQSLLSHGLTQLCLINEFNGALVDVVSPILDDLAKAAPDYATVITVDMGRSGTVFPYQKEE